VHKSFCPVCQKESSVKLSDDFVQIDNRLGAKSLYQGTELSCTRTPIVRFSLCGRAGSRGKNTRMLLDFTSQISQDSDCITILSVHPSMKSRLGKRSHENVAEDAFCCKLRGHSFGPQDVTDQEKVEGNNSNPILDNDNGIMRDMKTPCVENTERTRRRNELKKDNLYTLQRLLNSAKLDLAIASDSDCESDCESEY
jgi:hypothetical protein